MKKRFKQLLVAVLALTMVLTGALCVQAKTIQQFDLTYTLYPSKTKNYNFSRVCLKNKNCTKRMFYFPFS